MERVDISTGLPNVAYGRPDEVPGCTAADAALTLCQGLITGGGGSLVVMAAGVVTVAVLVLVPAAAAGTANSRRPDLLPEDCGRRLLQPDDAGRPLIADPTNTAGNTTAYYGQFPWQARIAVYKRGARGYVHQCGGIVITRRHVLTAAHCVDHVALRHMLVRVGDWRFGAYDGAEQEFGVSDFRVHRHYGDRTALANDIALLSLKIRRGDGIEFGWFVQPACLPEADTVYEMNTECEVSGWGKTADGAPISETLRGVSVPLVTDDFCSAPEVHRARFVSGRTFCAGLVRGGPDSCGGDSGGPLVCRDPTNDRFVAFGIVSTGDPRGCGKLPGLYTKLSGFVDWLLPLLQLDSEQDPSAVFEVGCGRADLSMPLIASDTYTLEGPDDLPWLVILHVTLNFTAIELCTGTVISERSILTTADCARHGVPLTARPAIKRPNGTDIEFDIIGAVRYPGGGPLTAASDLALLETSAPIPASSGVRPVCLLDQQRAAQLPANLTFLLADVAHHIDPYAHSLVLKHRVRQVPASDVGECSHYCLQVPRQNPEERRLRVGHAALRETTPCLNLHHSDEIEVDRLNRLSGLPLMAELVIERSQTLVCRWYITSPWYQRRLSTQHNAHADGERKLISSALGVNFTHLSDICCR